MPALPVVPGVLRADFGFQVGTDLAAMVRLHWRYTGTPPTNAVAATIAQDMYTAAGGAGFLPAFLHSDSYFTSVAVTDLSSATGGVGDYVHSTIGTRAGTRLPADAAFLVSYPISRRYRGGKPRSYWPIGVAEDLLTPQLWQGAFPGTTAANFKSWMDTISALTVSGCALGAYCGVSYYQGFTAVTNPITGRTRDVPKVRTGAVPVDDFLDVVGRQTVGSQRRRTLMRS